MLEDSYIYPHGIFPRGTNEPKVYSEWLDKFHNISIMHISLPKEVRVKLVQLGIFRLGQLFDCSDSVLVDRNNVHFMRDLKRRVPTLELGKRWRFRELYSHRDGVGHLEWAFIPTAKKKIHKDKIKKVHHKKYI